MAVALIVAAGRGERLGLAIPKALVPLGGRPMLEWSLEALRQAPSVHEIVVALPAEALGAAPDDVIAVAGGAQRSHSVRAALAACPDGDPVIVHDAARPLATAELFERAVAALLDAPAADAVVAAAPVADTVKEVAEGGHTVTRTLPRARLWAVQTPQVFRRAALTRALTEGTEELLARATDDAWLSEHAGGTVEVLPSDAGNLKVTTAHHLRVAELLLAARAAAVIGGAAGS
jgi:2-C-methyl-D-erythritol 4-phosphate cytidylyltransferase